LEPSKFKLYKKYILECLYCIVFYVSDTMLNITPFPPTLGWAVIDETYFETYAPIAVPGEPELSLLTKVDLQGNFTGDFRLLISGLQPLRAQFPAQMMIPIQEAVGFKLTIEVRPEEIVLRRNGVTSAWYDVDRRYR